MLAYPVWVQVPCSEPHPVPNKKRRKKRYHTATKNGSSPAGIKPPAAYSKGMQAILSNHTLFYTITKKSKGSGGILTPDLILKRDQATILPHVVLRDHMEECFVSIRKNIRFDIF